METNNIRLKTLLACLTAVIFVEAALVTADSGGLYGPLERLCTARVLEAVLIIVIVILLEKRISVIGLDRARLPGGLERGLIWSAGFGVAAFIAFIILTAAGASPLQYLRTSMPDQAFAGYFITGALIGPVAEELLFRGVIYGFFRQWGILTAVVLSTVIFTLAHSAGGGAGLTHIAGGIVFAAAYEREGSLMVPITIHVLGNAVIFSLSLLA